ncbi:acetyltransferase [uncultured Kocuria sp.]|uniref:acetyltransferase n=1 Tax=uncultured Kocuria sp. TaxID=259305 RepID=UPI00260282A0|nr:acetyltransferase [uncultured Kocuria sp.]
MATAAERNPADSDVPVIDLSQAPGEGEAWNRPKWMIYLWSATELVLVTNPWQISSGLRTKALRAFGAKIGDGVIIRPRTRIKFPWNLEVGDRSWIGEGVWIHNQDQVTIGHDAVVSQETFITTGSHAHRKDMGLITRPVTIEDGAWVTSRCVVTGGVTVGRSALVQPLTLVNRDVGPNVVLGPPKADTKGRRFAVGARAEQP